MPFEGPEIYSQKVNLMNLNLMNLEEKLVKEHGELLRKA
jgi:hypothetical protein